MTNIQSFQAALSRNSRVNEHAHITAVASRHARRYAVVPLLAKDPAGVARLQQLSRPLAHPDRNSR